MDLRDKDDSYNVRERERERKRLSVCLWEVKRCEERVCLSEAKRRERERERERESIGFCLHK